MTAAVDLALTLRQLTAHEQRWRANRGRPWGLPTGFRDLDNLTGGLHPGLTLLGARTSHGKTALACQIAINVALLLYTRWHAEAGGDGHPPGRVLIVSPEMNAAELMERHATAAAQVPVEQVKRGEAEPAAVAEWLQRAGELAELAPVLTLYAGRQMRQAEIVEIIASLADAALAEAGPPLALVVIDYLQRIPAGGLGGASEYQQLTALSHELKELANTYQLPILAASQLNRSIEKDHQGGARERPPELSDFHGGPLEMAADTALLLWRPPEETKSRDSGAQKAQLYVKKNRHGPVGRVTLQFYPHYVKFADMEYEAVTKDGGW